MGAGSIFVGVLLVAGAASWYGLQLAALRDLIRRPRVRGDNKLVWAFAILCFPYVGALSYLTIGPIGFLPREERLARRRRLNGNGSELTPPVGRRPSRRPSRSAVASTTRVGPVVKAGSATPMAARQRRVEAADTRRDVLLAQRPVRESALSRGDRPRWPAPHERLYDPGDEPFLH